eukprot:1954649-Prymnesium_polylepis.1
MCESCSGRFETTSTAHLQLDSSNARPAWASCWSPPAQAARPSEYGMCGSDGSGEDSAPLNTSDPRER